MSVEQQQQFDEDSTATDLESQRTSRVERAREREYSVNKLKVCKFSTMLVRATLVALFRFVVDYNKYLIKSKLTYFRVAELSDSESILSKYI